MGVVILCCLGAALFSATLFSVQAETVGLTVIASYSAAAQCVGNAAAPPVLVTATVVSSGSCTTNKACSIASGLYPATVCATTNGTQNGDFITTTLPSLFGAVPFVVVEKYVSNSGCASARNISSITAYVADGKCYGMSLSTSYRATRLVGGSVMVTTFVNNNCTSGASQWAATAAQASLTTGNSCNNSLYGIPGTKVYGSGWTPVYFQSTASYDTNTTNCKPPAVPSQLAMSVVAVDTCVATTACIAGTTAPFTRTSCSSSSTYRADIAATFGSNPYVIVETHISGTNCVNSAQLLDVRTYLADGKCHKTDSAYVKATRAADGSVKIITYGDSSCTDLRWTFGVAASQFPDSWCANYTNGNAISTTKVDGAGITPSTLQPLVYYDTRLGNCMTPVLPTHLVTSVVDMGACAATTTCTEGAEPYASTACSSIVMYRVDIDTIFGSNPYVTVETYPPGAECDGTELWGISTYLADGKCHKTATGSFVAVRAADGSAIVRISTSTANCSETSTNVSVTVNQVLNNACISSCSRQTCSMGSAADMKVYGGGETGMVAAFTMSYDTTASDCQSPGAVPTQLMSKIVPLGYCSPSTTCIGSTAPYSGTACSSASTYKADIEAAFGSNPHVMVETYISGTNCDPTQLTFTIAYLADGKCHETGTKSSYIATRATDGSATIKTHMFKNDCTGAVATLNVTADQASNNLCAAGSAGIEDKKIYGAGATTYVTAIAYYADTDCGTPVMLTINTDNSCTTMDETCAVSDEHSVLQTCIADYFAAAKAMFRTKPYLVVEMYKDGTTCGSNAGAVVLSADSKCHMTSDGMSFKVTLGADSGTMIFYDDQQCTSSKPDTVSLAKAELAAHTCIGNAKYYAFNAPASTSTTTTTTAGIGNSAVATYLLSPIYSIRLVAWWIAALLL